MKGVASANALDGEPGSLNDSMFCNSFASVLGASREKTAAMTNKWAERRLIKSNESYYYFFHNLFQLVWNSLRQYIFNLN